MINVKGVAAPDSGVDIALGIVDTAFEAARM